MIEIALEICESEDEIYEVISVLYTKLSSPLQSNLSLFKLLVIKEHIELFDRLIKEVSMHTTIDNSEDHLENDSYMRDKGTVYDLKEIISDGFTTAIIYNKMHIAFYLYREYRSAVLGNKDLCIDSIVYSFKNDLTMNKGDYASTTKLIYLEEKLYILHKFIPFMKYKQAYDFAENIKNLLLEAPESNFLTY